MGTRAPAELSLIYVPVEEDIARLTRGLDEEFRACDPFIGQILEHVAQFRGKQIRPALLFLASRLNRAVPGEDHLRIAAVIELIHTATLVHDDILDQAALRRNVSTVHRAWGERAAVLIGDYIYSRAFHISTEVPGMARILSDTTNTICEGELLQIANRFRPDMGETTYFEIIRKKTAILHAVSCQLGGVLGGANPAQCQGLYEFGMDLGMAFQIVDDCLDYAGNEAEAGKSLGTDLHQGKVTLPLIYLMECLSPEETGWLKGTLEKPLSREAEVRVHGMVEKYGVVGGALSHADSFVQSAKVFLARNVPTDASAKQAHESLELVSDYIIQRQR